MKTTTKSLVYSSLKILGLAGFSGVAIAAPNATKAMHKIFKDLFAKLDEPETSRIIRILKRQNLVQIDKQDEATYKFTITPAGAYRLQAETLDDIQIPTMKKWDGHWRMICYDIPISKSSERYELINQLHRLGFTMIQKSMWVHPHKCIEQVRLITDALLISKWVTVLEVVQLDSITTAKLIKRYQEIIKI